MQTQQEEFQATEVADPELERIASETQLSDVQRQINELEMMDSPERDRPKYVKRRERLWAKKRELLALMSRDRTWPDSLDRISGGR